MSLLTALLNGDKPTLHGFAQVFNVDEYRDKLSSCPVVTEDPKRGISKRQAIRTNALNKARQSQESNRTCKADSRYIKALRGKKLTTKEMSEAVGNGIDHVRDHMKILEAKGIVKRAGSIGNKCNSPVLWTLASSVKEGK